MRLDDDDIREIESLLGRSFDREELLQYETLNDISPQVIEELRRLPLPLGFQYLRSIAFDHDAPLAPFYQQVIEEFYDPYWWWISTLFQSHFQPDLLQNDNLEQLSTYRSLHDNDWYFRPLGILDWRIAQHSRGAPAIVNFSDRTRGYQWESPAHIVGYCVTPPLGSHSATRYSGDVRVLWRRWLASIIARKAADYGHPGPYIRTTGSIEGLYPYLERFLTDDRSPEQVVINLFPDVETPSDDAIYAVKGLFQEIADRSYTENRIPGYVGPDRYYDPDTPTQTESTDQQFPVGL